MIDEIDELLRKAADDKRSLTLLALGVIGHLAAQLATEKSVVSDAETLENLALDEVSTAIDAVAPKCAPRRTNERFGLSAVSYAASLSGHSSEITLEILRKAFPTMIEEDDGVAIPAAELDGHSLEDIRKRIDDAATLVKSGGVVH